MPKFSKFFKALDQMGVQPRLNINRKEKYNSICGSFLTISLIGLVIWALVVFSSDMVNKTNPNVVISHTIDDDPYMKLGADTFTLGIAMGNPFKSQVIVDPTLYQVFAQYFVPPQLNDLGEVVSEVSITPLSVHPCTNEDFGNKFYGAGYCLDEDQAGIEELKISEFENGFIYFSVFRCNNAQSPVECKSEEELDQFFQEASIYLFYPDNLIDSGDLEEPIQTRRGLKPIQYEPIVGKLHSIELSKIEYITDRGWLMKDKSTKISAQIASMEIDTGKVETSATQPDYSVMLTLTGKKIKYERSYLKLQGVLAEVTGLLSSIMAVIILLFNPYATHKYYETIANRLFTIRKDRIDVDQRLTFKTIDDLRKEMYSQKRWQRDDNDNSEEHPKKYHHFNNDFNMNIDEYDSKIFSHTGTITKLVRPEIKTIQEKRRRSSLNDDSHSAGKSGGDHGDSESFKNDSKNDLDLLKKEHDEDDSERRIIPVKMISDKADGKKAISLFSKLQGAKNNGGGDSPSKLKDNEAISRLVKGMRAQKAQQKTMQFNSNFVSWILNPVKKTSKEKKNDDVTLVKKAAEVVLKETDMISLLKRMVQFERFKNLILNMDQRVVFDNLPGPDLLSIHENEDPHKLRMINQLYQNFDGKPELAKQGYKNIKNSQSKSLIDQILLQAYEQEDEPNQ